MNLFILIPAYNEEKAIQQVIRSCQKLGYNNIIVVDDGSTDKTKSIAEKCDTIVISHAINRGAGAATQTGLEAAVLLGADAVVTMDADAQHDTNDIPKLVETLENKKVDVVIGSRFLKKNNGVPIFRKIFNKIANYITFILAGTYLTDSQSGMKIFNKNTIEKLCITANGYEFSTEIIREIRYFGLSVTEVPISVQYTEYSLSKGQNLSMGISTVFRLIIRSLMR